MEINYLKINSFGKLKNKEINLNKKINLIYGKNESGKTTLLKFIYGMFFGISKNKNGKEISDFEKYKPWDTEEFSGKITYKLDNGEEFEVFRNFTKKSPKIYNSNMEDISKIFNMDKNKGSQFFYDQTKIDENTFTATTLVEQKNIVLDKNNQNVLTQKIANIFSTGDDNISYNKVINNLSKKLIEEVGTDRTSERPLNIIVEKIKEIEQLKNEINISENKKNELEERKNKIKYSQNTLNEKINLIKEIIEYKQEENKLQEKIKINNNLKINYQEKINKLKNNLKIKNNDKKNNKKNIINLFLISILIIFNILINFINISNIIQNIIIYFTIIYLFLYFLIYLIKSIKNKKNKNKINIEKIKTEKEIEILNENINKINNEINNLENKIKKQNNEKIIVLQNKYEFNNLEIIKLFEKNLIEINKEYENENNLYNSNNLELNTILLEEKNINNNINKKIEYEEQLNYLEEEKKELENLAEKINMAKNTIEEAYNDMKREITPKFTKNLSKIIETITDGKYNKVKFDSNEGLIIEKDNGEYINCNNLSIGTVDQLYLALRISSMQEISEEKMPIILDEAFAFFDNERLKNILLFLENNYKENQIIIFTCSNREKEILDKLNIEYNFINL